MSTPTFSQMALVVALRQMFNQKDWFDWCACQDMFRLVHVTPSREDEAALRVLHCVNWRDMPQGMKQQVAEKVLAILKQPADYQLQIEITPGPRAALSLKEIGL